MPLTEEAALRAYATMINTLNAECIEPLIADDFIYESQQVFQPLESKEEFLEYIHGKLETIRRMKASVFAEMGTVDTFRQNQPCVILAQDDRDNLVGLALAQTEGEFLKRIDLCIAPGPQSAKRSGEYPA